MKSIIIILIFASVVVLGAFVCVKLWKRSAGATTEAVSQNLAADKLYKIVAFDGFDPEKETVSLLPLDIKSGYIHAALGHEQVMKVLNNFFGAESRVHILELDEQKLKQAGLEVRLEQNKPVGTRYPHIYGMMKLPTTVVARVIDATKQEDGVWQLQ